jgi:hypothetical protein
MAMELVPDDRASGVRSPSCMSEITSQSQVKSDTHTAETTRDALHDRRSARRTSTRRALFAVRPLGSWAMPRTEARQALTPAHVRQYTPSIPREASIPVPGRRVGTSNGNPRLSSNAPETEFPNGAIHSGKPVPPTQRRVSSSPLTHERSTSNADKRTATSGWNRRVPFTELVPRDPKARLCPDRPRAGRVRPAGSSCPPFVFGSRSSCSRGTDRTR